MRYPSFIKKGDTIGVCAPSFGTTVEPYISRLDNAIKKFNTLGYEVKLSNNVRNHNKGRSSDAKTRAKEFMELYLDDNIDIVFSNAGGEFMVEILPYIDFEKLKEAKPKYFQGYSDNTNLTFTLTTICDVATIYSNCIDAFGAEEWHKTVQDNYNFLCGQNEKLESLDLYEIESLKHTEGFELASFNCTEKVEWKILSGESEVAFEGRLLGGCLDILCCVCGTKFDKVKEFIEKYKDDGIVWCLESCDLTVAEQLRAIWQLKNAGWFKYAKGFIFGRPNITETMFDIDYKEGIFTHLKDMKVPVVVDADFGHVGPRIHMINGAYAKINSKNGKGNIEFILR